MKNIDEFLVELSALTAKYKIVIAGCGCCGSPSLWDEFREGEYIYKDNLEFVPKSDSE